MPRSVLTFHTDYLYLNLLLKSHHEPVNQVLFLLFPFYRSDTAEVHKNSVSCSRFHSCEIAECGEKRNFFKGSEWKKECKEEGKEKSKGKGGGGKRVSLEGLLKNWSPLLVLARGEGRKAISTLGKHRSKVHTAASHLQKLTCGKCGYLVKWKRKYNGMPSLKDEILPQPVNEAPKNCMMQIQA